MFQLRDLLWHRVGVRVRCRRPGQASAAGRLLRLKVPPRDSLHKAEALVEEAKSLGSQSGHVQPLLSHSVTLRPSRLMSREQKNDLVLQISLLPELIGTTLITRGDATPSKPGRVHPAFLGGGVLLGFSTLAYKVLQVPT